jgi:isocitrate lyase
VVKLQGSYQIEHSVARIGANTLWSKLNSQDFVAGLGALTGNQAIQVEAGLDAIYLSGWQVAADANVAGNVP